MANTRSQSTSSCFAWSCRVRLQRWVFGGTVITLWHTCNQHNHLADFGTKIEMQYFCVIALCIIHVHPFNTLLNIVFVKGWYSWKQTRFVTAEETHRASNKQRLASQARPSPCKHGLSVHQYRTCTRTCLCLSSFRFYWIRCNLHS